jgi:hypothetical protein
MKKLGPLFIYCKILCCALSIVWGIFDINNVSETESICLDRCKWENDRSQLGPLERLPSVTSSLDLHIPRSFVNDIFNVVNTRNYSCTEF